VQHRSMGYALLAGQGLEIGAFNEPAALPAHCRTRYADVLAPETARVLFPEIAHLALVAPDELIDLDTDGLAQHAGASLDYVILNHVIEHVANPLRVIGELFRVVRPGGHVVLSAPDKQYTFDARRASAPWEHLWLEFNARVDRVTSEHYDDLARLDWPEAFAEPQQDFVALLQHRLPGVFGAALGDDYWNRLRALAPGIFQPDARQAAVALLMARREHAHVWTSVEFQVLMRQAQTALGLCADARIESLAADNGLEYFSVWQRRAG